MVAVHEAPDVTIGLIIRQNTSAWRRTLDSLARNTGCPCRLLIIDDGAGVELPAAVPRVRHTAAAINPYCKGLAFCANTLIDRTDTPYLVLLEEGIYLTPGWLTDLIAILTARPDHGMAGPATSRAWNEQQVIDAQDWSDGRIEAFARRWRHEHAGRFEYLDTLHSLLPFCYAFKREVVGRIGYFDEGYGRGPCAEVDFSTRAARAGYRAVWAAGVYVHRFPAGGATDAQEAQLLGPARTRYQGKFCGLRLGHEGSCPRNFAHCLGEDCSRFAPPPAGRAFQHRVIPTPTSSLPLPLVSCIMPTANRRAFVTQAIECFRRQDYPHRELVIVDDGEERVRDLARADERVRYVGLPARLPLGEKRNIAVRASRGAIVAHWDDDDWHGPARLSYQVEPILQDEADITALDMRVVYDVAGRQAWSFSGDLHARLMQLDLHCGTLVYRRRVWEQLGQFQPVNQGEDALFVRDVFARGARTLKLANRGHFVYIRHAANTWPFACGSAWDASAWQRVPLPDFMPAADHAFYERLPV